MRHITHTTLTDLLERTAVSSRAEDDGSIKVRQVTLVKYGSDGFLVLFLQQSCVL